MRWQLELDGPAPWFWVSPALAAEIKARAEDERLSISAVIRLALETKSLGDVRVRRFES